MTLLFCLFVCLYVHFMFVMLLNNKHKTYHREIFANESLDDVYIYPMGMKTNGEKRHSLAQNKRENCRKKIEFIALHCSFMEDKSDNQINLLKILSSLFSFGFNLISFSTICCSCYFSVEKFFSFPGSNRLKYNFFVNLNTHINIFNFRQTP